MKKVTILSAFVLFLLAGLSANAQEQGEIRLQGGLALGTKAGVKDNGDSKLGLGINFGAEYLITDQLSIAPSYTIFFKNTTTIANVETKRGFNVLDIDARYYLLNDGVQVYGLVGFSSATAKVTVGGASASSSKSGVNVGAGLIAPLGDKVGVLIQAKYNSPLEQIGGNVGLSFTLN